MACSTRSTLHLAAAFVVLGLLAPASPGQDGGQPTSPGEPVKGPAVPDRGAGKGKPNAGFGPDAIERKKLAANRPTPSPSMAEFMRSLGVLRAPATPESARLTTEQDSKIKSLATAFEDETKSYMDKNKQELDSLRSQLSPTDRAMLDEQLARGGPLHLHKSGFGGKRNAAKHLEKGSKGTETSRGSDAANSGSSQATGDAAAKARARIVEVYSGRPRAEDAQAKILGVLNGDQLKLVQDELARHEPEHAHRHGHARGSGNKS